MRNHRVKLSRFAGFGGNRVGMALALTLALGGCEATPQQRDAERADYEARSERHVRLLAACRDACGAGGMDMLTRDRWTNLPLCCCRRPEVQAPQQAGGVR